MGNKTVSIVIAAVLGVLVIAGIWYMQRPPAPHEVAALTPEAKAYVRSLDLSDVTMTYEPAPRRWLRGKRAPSGCRSTMCPRAGTNRCHSW